MRQKSICECCKRIGRKANACIIRGPKFLTPSIIINTNQLNALHSEEPNEPPREWNIQPPAAHSRSITYPDNTIPMVSDITWIFNHHAIDNGDVEVHPLEFPFESSSESVPDPDTTPIKSIHDD